MIPRANERARSKAEGRTQHVQKPDISKRPSVIGTTKSAEPTSPTIQSKPKNRKPSSKASDIFPEPLGATDSSNLPGSQHYMKTQKITSPLNTPSVRDHLTSYSSAVSSHFPFQHAIPKADTGSSGQAVSNGVSNPVLPKNSAAVTETPSPKEMWKSPPIPSASKKSEKNEVAVNSTKAASSSDTKSSNKGSSNISKKRKNNKASNADEDGKKKQKTNTNHEKKTSYPFGGTGRSKMPILPPSPFASKSSSSPSFREM